MTENHNYNTPQEGATDWHIPLNENFVQLDTDIEIRDLESNLDTYTPKEGAKYLASDTGRRFLGDGTEWVEAPPQPLTQLSAPNRTDDPTDAEPGELWYREDTDEFRVQLASGVSTLATVSSDTDSGSDDTDSTHTLEIVAYDGADWDTYTIVIEGELLETKNLNPGDEITYRDDGTVLIEGGIKGGKDPETFIFDGILQSLSLEVDGTAYLDGVEIDPADY